MKRINTKYLLTFCLIVFMGSLINGVVDYRIYSDVINEDIEDITLLTSEDIANQIKTELVKPLFVSLTMANDQFLKDWIIDEDEKDVDKITSYLRLIKDKYNYSSVFFVSSITDRYYSYKGIHKNVSKSNEHDIWYYKFLELDSNYDLDVDTDEVNKNDVTVFVNCKIYSDNGRLLGVTGVGLKMSQLSYLFDKYRTEMNVDAFLVDKTGLIQVHSDIEKIERDNILDSIHNSNITQKILSKEDNSNIFSPKELGTNFYLISRYIEDLDWYLISVKDTSVLGFALMKHVYVQILTTIFVALAVIYINYKILTRSQAKLRHLATTDMLTGLNNRRHFDDHLKNSINSAILNELHLSLVLFDIDDFKIINDTYNHLVGDDVIKAVADLCLEFFDKDAVISRWGGDEFAIILERSLSDSVLLLNKFKQKLTEYDKLKKYGITLSIGISKLEYSDNPQSLLHRADKALYDAKKNGKNQIKY